MPKIAIFFVGGARPFPFLEVPGDEVSLFFDQWAKSFDQRIIRFTFFRLIL